MDVECVRLLRRSVVAVAPRVWKFRAAAAVRCVLLPPDVTPNAVDVCVKAVVPPGPVVALRVLRDVGFDVFLVFWHLRNVRSVFHAGDVGCVSHVVAVMLLCVEVVL